MSKRGQTGSGNEFHLMTKWLPFKLELEWYQMVVFKQEKMAKLRLPFCIDFKGTCVKAGTPSTKPIAPAMFSTDRRTIFIDFDMIHNQASNKSFRMRKSYIPQGARSENMFFMIYLLRDSERKFV